MFHPASVSYLYRNANEIVPKCKWNENVKWVKLIYPASLGGVKHCCRPSLLYPYYEAVRIGNGWGYSWVLLRRSTETCLYNILPNNPGTTVFYIGGGGHYPPQIVACQEARPGAMFERRYPGGASIPVRSASMRDRATTSTSSSAYTGWH
eukprot:2326786-Rhodomonas_salina.1